jgi:hypothetical protein
MNLRHAAALALVGWYLMLPTKSSRSLDYQPNLPLSQWSVDTSFDSADACESYRGEWQEKSRNAFTNAKPDVKEAARALFELYNDSACISSDDPRLKETK